MRSLKASPHFGKSVLGCFLECFSHRAVLSDFLLFPLLGVRMLPALLLQLLQQLLQPVPLLHLLTESLLTKMNACREQLIPLQASPPLWIF